LFAVVVVGFQCLVFQFYETKSNPRNIYTHAQQKTCKFSRQQAKHTHTHSHTYTQRDKHIYSCRYTHYHVLRQLPKMCSILFGALSVLFAPCHSFLAFRFLRFCVDLLLFSILSFLYFLLSVCFCCCSALLLLAVVVVVLLPFLYIMLLLLVVVFVCSFLVRSFAVANAATSKLCPRLTPCLLFSALALLFMRCPVLLHKFSFRISRLAIVSCILYLLSVVCLTVCLLYLLGRVCVCVCECVSFYLCICVCVCVCVCACCSLEARGAFMMCA